MLIYNGKLHVFVCFFLGSAASPIFFIGPLAAAALVANRRGLGSKCRAGLTGRF